MRRKLKVAGDADPMSVSINRSAVHTSVVRVFVDPARIAFWARRRGLNRCHAFDPSLGSPLDRTVKRESR